MGTEIRTTDGCTYRAGTPPFDEYLEPLQAAIELEKARATIDHLKQACALADAACAEQTATIARLERELAEAREAKRSQLSSDLLVKRAQDAEAERDRLRAALLRIKAMTNEGGMGTVGDVTRQALAATPASEARPIATVCAPCAMCAHNAPVLEAVREWVAEWPECPDAGCRKGCAICKLSDAARAAGLGEEP